MSKLFVNTIAPNSGDTVTVSGSLTTTGKLTIGDATSDTVAFVSEISSSLIPDIGATYALGTMAKSWGSAHIHGLGHIHTASIGVVSSSLLPDAGNTYSLGSNSNNWLSASLNHLNVQKVHAAVSIGSIGNQVGFGYFNVGSFALLAGKGTISGGTISMSAHLHPVSSATVDLGTMNKAFRNLHAHGLGHIRTASINTVSSSLIPLVPGFSLGSNSNKWENLISISASISTASILTASITHVSEHLRPLEDDTYDLGSSTKQWRNLHIDGTANIDTADINNLVGVNTATITTGSITNIICTGSLTANLVEASTHVSTSKLIINKGTSTSVDSATYTVNGNKVEVRTQLQAQLNDGTFAAFKLHNTSIATDSVVMGAFTGGTAGVITGSIITANTIATHTASFRIHNETGGNVPNDTGFTASFVIL